MYQSDVTESDVSLVTGSDVSHMTGSDASHVTGSDAITGSDVISPALFFLTRVVVQKTNNTMTKRYQRNNQKP